MARTLKDKLLFRNNQRDKKKIHNTGAFELTFGDGNGASETWTKTPPRPRSSFSRLKESFRLFGRSKPSSSSTSTNSTEKKQEVKKLESHLDPPRFSYDAQLGDFSCPEPPRRSLDSRILLGRRDSEDDEHVEPHRKSFDVSMLSKAHQSRDKKQRLNVVAKLMGLTDMAEAPRNSLEELLKHEATLVESKPVTQRSESPDQKDKLRQLKQEKTQRETDVPFHKVVERLERLQLKQAQQEISRGGGNRKGPRKDSSLQGHKTFLDELQRLKQLKAVEQDRSSSKHDMQLQGRQLSHAPVSIVVLRTRPGSPDSQGHGRDSLQTNMGRNAAFLTKSTKQHKGTVSLTYKKASQDGAVHQPKPVISSRIPAATVTGKRTLTSHESHCKVYASNLMKPTVASSSRVQSVSKPSRQKIRRRDHTESRAALLNWRKSTPAGKRATRSDQTLNEPVLVVKSEPGPASEETYATTEKNEKKTAPVLPGTPKAEKSIEVNLEHVENLSPVSVLDVVPYEEEEERLRSFQAQVRKVELDKKPKPTSPELPRSDQKPLTSHTGVLKLKVFSTLLDQDEDTECLQHWNKNQTECLKCMSVICQQIDAAILDDLVYEAIIHLT